MGLRQVVVTGALDITIQPLLRYLGITEYVANQLEFVDGRATGRLKPPIMASATKASWIRTYTEKEGLPLNDCYAYADSMSDLPMLSVVGHPDRDQPRPQAQEHRLAPRLADRESPIMPVLRRKLDPGTVYIDTDSAPRVIQFGEDFWEEDLPSARASSTRSRRSKAFPTLEAPSATRSTTRSAAIRCTRS